MSYEHDDDTYPEDRAEREAYEDDRRAQDAVDDAKYDAMQPPQEEPSDLDYYGEPDTFRKSLEAAINAHSKEQGSNTPDFILAEYLETCLNAYNWAIQRREQWHAAAPIAPEGDEDDTVSPALRVGSVSPTEQAELLESLAWPERGGSGG